MAILVLLMMSALPTWAAIVKEGDVGDLYMGKTGVGSMVIDDGSVFSPTGTFDMGRFEGQCLLTVKGPGTVWNGSAYALLVRSSFVHVSDGAKMYVGNDLSIAANPDHGKAAARFDGAGTYLNAGMVDVGTSTSRCMLTFTGGATADIGTLNVYGNGRVGVKVTGNDQLTINTLQCGTIFLMADNNLANGTYTPVKITYTNTGGTVRVFGGTWDAKTGNFTVTDAVAGATGQTFAMNHGDRAVITDSATGKQLTYSAEWSSTPGTIQTVFSVMSQSELDAVRALDDTLTVLSGWWHDIIGSSQAMFTLNIGVGQDVEGLVFWQRSTTGQWEQFTPELYTYEKDGTLSFISSNLSNYDGFVVTGMDPTNIPEPATVLLLAAGGAALLSRRRRR
ncbi:MAG: PEP-CTERM sorting domain-containing protein [Phycisphaerae bacterium]|nr:PEP-CTERM sorting domain-containing protein [Phycisphaerae bacterium]